MLPLKFLILSYILRPFSTIGKEFGEMIESGLILCYTEKSIMEEYGHDSEKEI